MYGDQRHSPTTHDERLEVVVYRDTGLLGREKNYKLPQTLPVSALIQIAKQFEAEANIKTDEPLHLVGIVNGGVPMASELAMWLKLSNHFDHIFVSRIDPRKSENTLDVERVYDPGPCRTILIDSSIRSGDTAAWGLDLLKKMGFSVTHLVKLFGYGDTAEREVDRRLEQDFGVDVIALFGVDQLSPIHY